VHVLHFFTCFPQVDISYDKFIRTTDPKHEAIVKEFYSRVLANGDIYRADYEGLYCVNCEEYKVVFLFEVVNVDVTTLS
jgi:methionyl-tRNA synthetase